MKVGVRIKSRRKQIGMSAEQLAEKIGKSPATVYRYENGEIRAVDSEVLLPIADALGVTPGYLMGWDDHSPMDAQQDIFDDPDRKALLNLAKYGSADEVRQIAAIYKAVRDTNPDFYDGDDPA